MSTDNKTIQIDTTAKKGKAAEPQIALTLVDEAKM